MASASTAPILTIEPAFTPVTGIWDAEEAQLFTRYQVSLTFTGRVLGGVPQKPEIVESWLRQRITGGDEEVRTVMLQTLDDLGMDVSEGMTMEQLHAVAKDVAAKQHGNTFRRDEQGLFLSAYQFKAALKENTNILFAGSRWGVTKKGPKSFLSERVFIDQDRVYLGREEPDGMQLQIGHVTGPQGPKSTLTYYDYCNQPSCVFSVSSMKDEVTLEQWRDIFLSMQRNGVGALRSQGYGQFRVTAFEKLKA